MAGKLFVVGFGPGAAEHLTFRAEQAIREADMVVGYNTYLKLVRHLTEGKEIVPGGMQEEIGRAQAAVAHAEAGKRVAVISSGDAGIYGMAGIVYEVLRERGWDPDAEGAIQVEVVPGVTAMNACAALVGAPIMHDFCGISLSDLLTPWEVISKRVEAAAAADFVISLYNPASGRRTWQIVETVNTILKYRKPETPVVLIKSGYRDRQKVVLTDLAHCLECEIGMLTTIIIGSSSTFSWKGLMITPRGYAHKYDTGGNRRDGIDRWESLKLEKVSGRGPGFGHGGRGE